MASIACEREAPPWSERLAYLLPTENKKDGELSGEYPTLDMQLLHGATREVNGDPGIEIRELQWTHQCSRGRQASACFQRKKKTRAV